LTYKDDTGYLVSYECKLDAASYVACGAASAIAQTVSYSSLSQGSHTILVRATMGTEVESTPLSITFTVDSVAPVTTLVTSSYYYATGVYGYEVSRESPTDIFECSIDLNPLAACSDSGSYSSLTDGTHTLNYRSTDATGNVEATRTTSFNARNPGALTITSGPTGEVLGDSQTFAFNADVAGPYDLRCAIDAAAPVACSSPYTAAGLARGTHTFTVSHVANPRIITSAVRSFEVGVRPDTVFVSGPTSTDTTFRALPTLLFASATPGATFECSTDGKAFVACSSPYVVPATLSDGAHGIAVRARAGSFADESPVDFRFALDRSIPYVSVQLTQRGNSITWKLTSSKPGSTFECRFNMRAYEPCPATGSRAFRIGSHVMRVRATDATGNQSEDAEVAFTIGDAAAGKLKVRFVTSSATRRLSYVLRKGYSRRIQCSRACTPSGALYVARGQALRLGWISRSSRIRVIQIGQVTRRSTGTGAVTLHFRIKPRFVSRVKRARALWVNERIVTTATGARHTSTRSFKLSR
jgi:hypothetical protein